MKTIINSNPSYQHLQQQDQSGSGMMPPAPSPYPGETGSTVNMNPDGIDVHVGNNSNSRLGWDIFNSHQQSIDNSMSNMPYGTPSVAVMAMGGFNIASTASNNSWTNVSTSRTAHNSQMQNMILASLVGGEPASSMNKHLSSSGNFQQQQQQQQQTTFDSVRMSNFAARGPSIGGNRHRNINPSHIGGQRSLNSTGYPAQRNPLLYQFQRKNNLPAVSSGKSFFFFFII